MTVQLISDGGLRYEFPGGYAHCIDFSRKGMDKAAAMRCRERARFFEGLTESRLGGILASYDTIGSVTGWASFLDKKVARELLWPCSRKENGRPVMVVGCLLVDLPFRGRGVAGTLLDALERLAMDWGYPEIEAPCRDEDTRDPDLTFQTPAPFVKRGYIEIERFHCKLMYPAEFSIWKAVLGGSRT